MLYDKIVVVEKNLSDKQVTVHDKLDQTALNTKLALSAHQGYELKKLIDTLDAKIKSMTTNTNTETWQFTLVNGTTVSKKVVLQ